MKRLSFLLLFLSLTTAPIPALASEHGGGGGEGGEKKESAAKGDDAEISGGQFEGDPVYVRLKPVILPIISDDGAEQLVNLIIHLEVKDMETATSLNGNKPRLNDAVIRALYGGFSDGSMRNANALNIVRIKDGIRTTINEIFGAGTIKEVLLQAVEQRRF